MSTISAAVPSPIAQGIIHLSSQVTWESALAVSSTLESAFYASVKAGALQAGRVVKWIRTTATEHIHEIQALFNTLNAGALFFYAHKLVKEIQGKYAFSAIAIISSWTAGILPPLLMGGAAFAVGDILLKKFSKNSPPAKIQSGVEIAERMSFQQQVAKWIHVTKLVLNVGLACFAKNRFWFVVTLAGTGYSFLKNLDIKWLKFTRTFSHHSNNRLVPITQVKATYNMLALTPDTASQEKECSICLEPQTDTAFCMDHVFHKNCMTQAVVHKSDAVMNGAYFLKRTTRHYTNGVYTGTSHNYSVTIPQENLPSCPNCRDYPLQNDCEFKITDAVDGEFNASVTIKGRPSKQPLFETLYAGYSMAQAGLAYLQKYPEFTATIFKVQQVMILTDIVALGLTIYYLSGELKKKWDIQPENGWKFNLAAGVAIVAFTALSYFAVLKIGLYLKSAVVLKDILAELPLPAQMLQNIDVSWASPFSLRLMEWLYFNRTVATFALSFFSKQKITNLLSGAAQAFSFAGVAQLPFIELTKTFTSPLEKVIESGGSLTKSLNAKSLQNLSVTTEFLVPPACAKEPSHMRSVVQSICKFGNKVLDKSSWDRYWLVTYNNGVETARQISYKVNLANNPLEGCDCTLVPSITGVAMSGVDLYYGKAAFSVYRS